MKYFLIISLITNGVLAWMLIKQNQGTKVPIAEESQMTEKTKEVPKKINIVMLGNSITYQGNWSEVLGRDDVFNGGQPGWTTQQLSWVIKDYIIPNNPVLCFFKGGINDYTLGIPTERIYKNICENMDSIKAVGTNPVYQATLYQRGNVSVNLEIDILNNKMKQFCEDKNYDFVDFRPFLCTDGDIQDMYVKDDNTHLEPEAYPQWAEAIKPIIEKYGL